MRGSRETSDSCPNLGRHTGPPPYKKSHARFRRGVPRIARDCARVSGQGEPCPETTNTPPYPPRQRGGHTLPPLTGGQKGGLKTNDAVPVGHRILRAKYASSGRVRAGNTVAGSWPLRNHLRVFGKGVQSRETRDFAKGFFPWRAAF
jgi:hypothetical protein